MLNELVYQQSQSVLDRAFKATLAQYFNTKLVTADFKSMTGIQGWISLKLKKFKFYQRLNL